MPTVFVSYRRDDAVDITWHICDRLQQALGKPAVYIDQETIPPGVDFHKHITDAVQQCQVLVAVIGPQWVSILNSRRHPLPDAAQVPDDLIDYVQLELEAALARKIRVIPVLVGGAATPSKKDLPESLRVLLTRNCLTISGGWQNRIADIVKLCDAVQKEFDEYEAIQRRLAERREMRIGLLVAAGILAALVGAVSLSVHFSRGQEAPASGPIPPDRVPVPPGRAAGPPERVWFEHPRVKAHMSVLGSAVQPALEIDQTFLAWNPLLAVTGAAGAQELLPLQPLHPLFR